MFLFINFYRVCYRVIIRSVCVVVFLFYYILEMGEILVGGVGEWGFILVDRK